MIRKEKNSCAYIEKNGNKWISRWYYSKKVKKRKKWRCSCIYFPNDLSRPSWIKEVPHKGCLIYCSPQYGPSFLHLRRNARLVENYNATFCKVICCFKKWGHPRPLCDLFSVFSHKHDHFYNNIMWKCPSSIRCWDLNPQPLERGPSPITTRPGLKP